MGTRVCRPVPAEQTTLEMLDAIENILHSLRNTPRVAGGDRTERARVARRAPGVRAALLRSGLPPAGFAAAFAIDRVTLDSWMTGESDAPDWVEGALRLIELLPPSARRRMGGSAWIPRVNSHPFACIEDL